MAVSEVMQYSLNVVTAEPASRVCLPISFSCLQLSGGQGLWGLLEVQHSCLAHRVWFVVAISEVCTVITVSCHSIF